MSASFKEIRNSFVGLRRSDITETEKSKSRRYLLFDADYGGMNNVIIGMQFAAFLAKSLNRILILPPPQAMLHVDWVMIDKIDRIHMPTTVTDLEDVVDISSETGLGKVIHTISFRDFVLREEGTLNLPWKGNVGEKYSRIKTDYMIMKVLGERLREDHSRNGFVSRRSLHFLERAKYLESLCVESDVTDWPSYAAENFWTPSSYNPIIQKEHWKNYSKHLKIIFFPIDPYQYTPQEKYPRLFDCARVFTFKLERGQYQNQPRRIIHYTKRLLRRLNSGKYFEKAIWEEVTDSRNFHYDMKYFELAIEAINNCLGGVKNYLALHYRSKEFDLKREQTQEDIISYLNELRYLNNLPPKELIILYVSTDNPEWFTPKKFLYSNFKIFLWDDIKQTVFSKQHTKHVAVIEQIICGYSRIFIGTGGSTFTLQIKTFRDKMINGSLSYLLPKTREIIL